jgi:hypothetical protein
MTKLEELKERCEKAMEEDCLKAWERVYTVEIPYLLALLEHKNKEIEKYKKVVEALKDFQSKHFSYITRDNLWSFKGNQYKNPYLSDDIGKDLDKALELKEER